MFSAAPQGADATQLTSSAGQCGFDATFKLVCEVGNPNGPENWHVSVLRLLLFLRLAFLFAPVSVVVDFAQKVPQCNLENLLPQTSRDSEQEQP